MFRSPRPRLPGTRPTTHRRRASPSAARPEPGQTRATRRLLSEGTRLAEPRPARPNPLTQPQRGRRRRAMLAAPRSKLSSSTSALLLLPGAGASSGSGRSAPANGCVHGMLVTKRRATRPCPRVRLPARPAAGSSAPRPTGRRCRPLARCSDPSAHAGRRRNWRRRH